MKTTTLFFAGFAALLVFWAGIQIAFSEEPQIDKTPYCMTVDELDRSLDVKPGVESPDDYVRVLYFHRVPGCATCQKMSKYIYETILTAYSNEVVRCRVILRYYDFEDPQNAKLVKTFKISSPSLVLVQGRGGKDVKAKKADQIWSLAKDKAAFVKYVGNEIDGYLKSPEM